MHETVFVDHLIRLDGGDDGPATIELQPSGAIGAVRPGRSGTPPLPAERTALPLLADAHLHLGISDGVTNDPSFHTRERVDEQLLHMARRGVGHAHSLGTDQRWLQDLLRRRLASGDAAGKAFGYSAGVGFGAIDGWPPEFTGPEPRFRPADAATARHQVRELAGLGCRTLKIWVEELDGTLPAVPRDVVGAVLDEASACGILTFAHVFTHDDAAMLVSLGVGVLAHSVRDRELDAQLVEDMLERGTALVPTLARDEAEYAFSVDENPYFRNGFFLESERPIAERLRGTKTSNDAARLERQLDVAIANVALAHAAGVPIGLGTDSGLVTKLQGFAQHRELELLQRAGLSPGACLRAALDVNRRLFATAMTAIAPGAPASFFIVDGNPVADVRATQRIQCVWASGTRIV